MLNKRFFKTKDECEVSFECAVEAQSVALAGEFNNWAPAPMSKRRKDGVFYAKVRLPKNNRFQFRYLVDGHTWINDDAADAYVPNQHGSDNSVVDTTPAA